MKARILSLGALFPMLAMTTSAMKTQEKEEQQQQSNSNRNSNSISKSGASPAERRNLIIGGEIAPPGRYPYFSTLEHYCGGALIAPDVILTAGHCKPSRHDGVQPHVGRYTYSHHIAKENEDYQDKVFDIVAAKRHPDWLQLGDDEFVHDFSLLFLNGTYDRPYIRINQNDQVPINGQAVVGMGVGYTSNDFEAGDSRSKTLREVTLNYLDSVDCRQSQDPEDPDNNNFQHRIHASHMCTTGGKHNERDACAYDSGSPIIVPGKTPQEDLLVALVSWGEGCADPNFPGVNARVSDAFDWIAETVCEYSDHAPPEFRCGGTDAPTMAPSASSSSGSGHTTTTTTMAQRFSSFFKHLSVICVFLAAFYVVLKLCRQCRSQDDDNDWILQKKWVDQQNANNNNNDDDNDGDAYGGEKANLVCSSPMGESKASTGTSKTETSSDSNNTHVSYDAIDMDV